MCNIGIITAASEKYANSLFCLIGSLNCNWPNHPPIVVYDLGLSTVSITELLEAKIEIKQIPHFCDHWRAHYTWKIWCLKNSDFEITVWMDAGMCVLKPLDELTSIIINRGYFLVPNYQFLDYEASEQACIACGVNYHFRYGKGSIAGTFIGFLKNSLFSKLIDEAYEIALDENNIKSYSSRNKHDQSIISILTYKYFPNPELEDGLIYLGWKSPKMIKDQKIWLQRRQILKEDINVYKRFLSERGVFHMPKDPMNDLTFFDKSCIKVKSEIKTLGKKLLLKKKADGIK